MRQKLRKWCLWWAGVVLFLAYLLPNHYSPWLSFHQEFTAGLAFTPLFVWASFKFKSAPALAWGAAVFSLVPILQLVFGQLYFAIDGLMAALYLLGFALAVHAGAQCVDRSPNVQTHPFEPLTVLWVWILIAALWSTGIAAYQWLMLGNQGIYTAELPPNGRPFGNLAQPNQLATLLLLGLMGLIFLWEKGALRFALALAAAFILVWGLVMTGSRSTLLALAWLLPLYAVQRRRCTLRTTPAAILCVVTVYLVLSFLWPHINQVLLMADPEGAAVERLTSVGIRKVYWLSMLDAIGRAPWQGYGWGQVGIAQLATALEYPPTYSYFESSHNLFLDLALWNGVFLAAMVIVGLLVWIGWHLLQCRDALSWITLMAVGVVFSHAMVEYPLNYAYFLLPVGLWMGALSYLHKSKIDKFADNYFFNAVAKILIPIATVGVLFFSAVVVKDYFPLEADWQLMRFQEARIGNPEPTEPPSTLVLDGVYEFLRFSRTEAKPDMSDAELEWMRKVSSRYAYASSLFRYALAQALNRNEKGAQKTLQKICQMHSVRSCVSARHEWMRLSEEKYPQLVTVPFPIISK